MTGAELNKILNEYGGNISRFCYSLCKNEYEAEELYQETCLKLLKSDFTIRSKQETLSFAYQTCRSVYRDTYRQIQRRSKYEVRDLDEDYIENIPDITTDDYIYDDLYNAVNKLSSKYKSVITLIYFDELSEKEAAQILGIPPGTVKSRLYKAKQLLKKELEKNENYR